MIFYKMRIIIRRKMLISGFWFINIFILKIIVPRNSFTKYKLDVVLDLEFITLGPFLQIIINIDWTEITKIFN